MRRSALCFAVALVSVCVATLLHADDPFDDLVVAVPWEHPLPAVEWIYGSGAGLTDLHSTLRADEYNYNFWTLTSGDFNGDLLTDLVIAAPWGNVGSSVKAGLVTVCYGTGNALDPFSGPCVTLTRSSLGEYSASGDNFGYAAAVGDFDGDGLDDLALGVLSDGGGAINSGSVIVVYGHPAGLALGGIQHLQQGSGGLEDAAEAGEAFGAALAASDLNGDGYCDLAVGVPGENSTGAVHLVYGSAEGLSTANDALWTQGDLLPAGEDEVGDRFGGILTAGDVNGDGYSELVVGDPYEDLDGVDEGMATVLLGSPSGIGPGSEALRLYQGTALVGEVAENSDYFSYSLSMGDFNGDGYADLVVGVPYESFGTSYSQGLVHVLYGSAGGFVVGMSQIWHQGGELGGDPEDGDYFGYALTCGDLDGDGYDDLGVGAPWEDVGTIADAGAVSVIYGSATGLVADGNQLWHQNALDLVGQCEEGEYFGVAVTSLRSRGIFADGFEPGGVDAWQGQVRIWTCAPTLYGAGDGCQCGCGVVDPDCLDATAAACDVCDAAGSCASSMGCDVLDPTNNAVCW